jgi:5'-3' exonuclease
MQVHLVDGTYELFRAFYGAPSAVTGAGREVGATRALARTLMSLLAEPEVSHVAVAFDHVIESFRNDLFEGYKTGEGIDPHLFAQFGLAESITRALGIVVWPMIEFEADDGLATGAVRFAAEPTVTQVVLCSPDKDLAQCVSGNRIICRDRMRRKDLDADGVRTKFGVDPASIPDYLALVGDSADGIPGIPRWGAKSAAAVLSTYGHIEHIPDSVEDWTVSVRGAPALAENLAELREEAALYKRLATLRTDAPIEEPLDALRWQRPVVSELKALCVELEDDSIVERATAISK